MPEKMIRGFGPMLLLPAIWVLAALASASAQSPGGMGQSAGDYLKPIVSQHQFADLIRPLELAREQRMIVELVYEDYRDTVEAVRRETDQAADGRGRRIIADALAGRRVVPPDELRHYRIEVLKLYRELPARAHQLVDSLISDVRSVITREQRPKFDEQLAAFRRMLYLHPRHLGRGDYEYAGEGVDVLLLVRDAREDGGELSNVSEAVIRPILDAYERELDALLRRTAVGYHEATIDARIARISRDHRAAREAEQRSLEQWQALYELNQRTVDRISEIVAREVDDEAAADWQRRFKREIFAWMFTPTRPDRIYQSMVRQSLDDDRLAEAKDILEDFQHDRWPLLREAADIMIRARSEFETVVYSMMDPSGLRGTPRSLYQELLLNSGRLMSIESRAVADLESLLDDEERRLMRRELRSR